MYAPTLLPTPFGNTRMLSLMDLSKIKVGRDGLIIKHGFYSGLLLPQVPVEYGWNEEEFLEYTCEKAGLPKNYWKNPDTEIQKFEGIVFKEEKPNGVVIRETL